MTSSIQAILIKPAIPVVYGLSGWIIAEIPVALGALPQTFDGYSTAGLAAGLAFLLSGAMWVHNELAPYISPPATGPSPSPTPVPTPVPTPAPTPAPVITLTASATTAAIGSTVTFTVTSFNGNYELYDDSDTSFTQPQANGTLPYVITANSTLGIDLAQDGYVDVYAEDAEGNKSNSVRITLASG